MIRIEALPTSVVRALRAGGHDANGQPTERALSDGGGNPCRHCLQFIPEGAPMLICAHRPFDGLHPYAETGPIFLCADDCPRFEGDAMPPVLTASADYLVKGYRDDERIAYGTGGVVAAGKLVARAEKLLSDPAIAFVDVRSARNNCFQARFRGAA